MPKKPPELLTKEEVNQVLDYVKGEDEYFYLLLLTLKKTARRIGELYGVKERIAVGKKSVTTKRGKQTEHTIWKINHMNWSGGLKVSDLHLDRNIMFTEVLKRRKRVKKECIVVPELVPLFEKHIKKNHLKYDDHVFRIPGYSYRTLQKKIGQYARRSGLKKNFTLHNFRHYTITELVRAGLPYSDIQKITGHSSLSTLSSYDHALASDIKDRVMGKLEEI